MAILVCKRCATAFVYEDECFLYCAFTGGYISINYSMMLPIFLATLDLFSDVMFIYRLSNSQYIFGRVFLVAALAVLCSSIFFNSIAFFGIFIYSHKRDKVSLSAVCMPACASFA